MAVRPIPVAAFQKIVDASPANTENLRSSGLDPANESQRPHYQLVVDLLQ
jgi:hypothetical protein